MRITTFDVQNALKSSEFLRFLFLYYAGFNDHAGGVEPSGLTTIHRFEALDMPINSTALNVLAYFTILP